ncbi:MAG: bifunctional 5,10-methylenetetrahydrofolate dehydrogenase/5,10-methenyltetrahydrofolate cyclohydrolase [Patescibacteria group bacterium]
MAIINGTEIAKEILERLKNQPKPTKFLAAVLVGDDPASASFIRQKEKVAKELGVDFRLYQFPATITKDELRDKVLEIVSDKACGGVIVQLPLPNDLDKHYILNVVPQEKDVDVLGEQALGAFYLDRNPIHPPAVAVVEEIVGCLKIDLAKTKVAVIGVGLLVGKPISLFLEGKAEKLEVFHRSSGNFQSQLKDFDLVISGAGSARLFSAKDLNSKALVIDFGYDEHDGKMVGDFDPSTDSTGSPQASSGQAPKGGDEKAIAYTPTPGGTGPILVAKLYENFYTLIHDFI